MLKVESVMPTPLTNRVALVTGIVTLVLGAFLVADGIAFDWPRCFCPAGELRCLCGPSDSVLVLAYNSEKYWGIPLAVIGLIPSLLGVAMIMMFLSRRHV